MFDDVKDYAIWTVAGLVTAGLSLLIPSDLLAGAFCFAAGATADEWLPLIREKLGL